MRSFLTGLIFPVVLGACITVIWALYLIPEPTRHWVGVGLLVACLIPCLFYLGQEWREDRRDRE